MTARKTTRAVIDGALDQVDRALDQLSAAARDVLRYSRSSRSLDELAVRLDDAADDLRVLQAAMQERRGLNAVAVGDAARAGLNKMWLQEDDVTVINAAQKLTGSPPGAPGGFLLARFARWAAEQIVHSPEGNSSIGRVAAARRN